MNDIPMWLILIVIMLPITVGIILLTNLLEFIGDLIKKFKIKKEMLLEDFGFFVFFIIMFSILINIMLYLLGDQPEGFSIFDYLIEEQLPIVIYIIFLYGIISNLQTAITKRRSSDESD